MVNLVTGGCGFIGSHIVEELLRLGRRVRVVDDLSTGHLENIDTSKVEFIQGDCSDLEVAHESCRGVETVYHLAARASVPFSFEHPEVAKKANLDSTLSIIKAAEENNIQSIIFSSSSAVYGDEKTLPKTEQSELCPLSPYAEHKLAGEKALQETKIPNVALRYFNVFGPRQDPSSPYSGVISLFMKWALEGKAAKMYGDGKQTRDFVYVKDVVKANLLASNYAVKNQGHSVVNIGIGQTVTIQSLWKMICEATNTQNTSVEYLPSREGDIKDSFADISLAKTILSFKADFGLKEGLKQIVDYQ